MPGGLFGQGGLPEEEQDEDLDMEQLMENTKVTHDCFIQNSLKSTSHTVQWLPYKEEDQTYKEFNKEFILYGTHYTEDDGEMFGQDEVIIATVRVPKITKSEKSVVDYGRLKKDHSKL